MARQTITTIQDLQYQAASLLLYQSVLQNEIGQAFLVLLQAISHQADAFECLSSYGEWFRGLASRNQTWQDFLIEQIICTDNPFSQQVQHTPLVDLSPALLLATKHDLQVLQSICNCDSAQLSKWLQESFNLSFAPIVWQTANSGDRPLHDLFYHQQNWADTLESLANYYRQAGTGLFATYTAVRWQAGQFVGIAYPDPVKLIDLASYESQRHVLQQNTEFLLAGYPALHVLLYGSRGTGKSSLVKALLHEYNQQGLRLVEVGKSELQDLPGIADRLRSLPQKFIIFVDDLSFEEDDNAFKALKVVLEGSLTARPQNVVVYATSNRRHLIREFFGDRPRPSEADEEVHSWDTLQEKLSFSDRFGLTLTFTPPDQDTYLEIVDHLAAQANLNLAPEDLKYQALQWATRRNGRSGRTARQFIDFLTAELSIKSKAFSN